MKLDNFASKKLISIFLGLLFIAIIIYQFSLAVNQPVSNLGFKFSYDEPYYFVSSVIENSPADKAGLTPDSFFTTINGISVETLIQQKKEYPEETFRSLYADFFKFGEGISLIGPLGEKFNFTLTKLPLWDRIRGTDIFIITKMLVAIAMIIASLVFTFCTGNDKHSRPLGFFIFGISLALTGTFDPDFIAINYSKITSVVLDVGIYFSLTCLLAYFANIFTSIKRFPHFLYVAHLPVLYIASKYIYLALTKTDLVDNVFYKINAFTIEICCLVILVLFTIVIKKFKSTLTTTFRFFLIGIFFAIVPIFINHGVYVATGSYIMSVREKILNVSSFTFLPFMLLLSVLFNKRIINSYISAFITSVIAYIIFSIPIFIGIFDYVRGNKAEKITLLYILFIPLVFSGIKKLITIFFAIKSNTFAKELVEFDNELSTVYDVKALCILTAVTLRKELDYHHIMFTLNSKDNRFKELFVDGELTDEYIEGIKSQVNKKRKLQMLKDGSICFVISKDSVLDIVIFIGYKKNLDPYYSTELTTIEEYLDLFFKRFLFIENIELTDELQKNTEKVLKMQEETIISMANLIESRDGGTGEHVKRTAEYSTLIARYAKAMGLFTDTIDEEFISLLKKAAPMHDIGKIVVSDAVLKKPGRLDPDEFEEMKRHTTEGEKIVREVLSNSENENYIRMTSNIAMYHHEWWNGNGYPKKIQGTDIPLEARILAIADVFDALVSPRCYKAPKPAEEAFDIIEKESGTHFDPDLAKCFLSLKEEALLIMKSQVF
ncbi:MAG: HD domain-containing protein [Treponema sp.]|nr:HD domain-containing protein [Treponema sp.]